GLWKLLKPKAEATYKSLEIILLVFPLVLACLSSFLGYYSMIARLMLFTMPIQILVAAIGVDYIAGLTLFPKKEWLGYPIRVLGLVAACYLVYGLNAWLFLQKGYKIV